jgi:hypothetical protein
MSFHISVYIGTIINGKRNKSAANIRIRITAITDPNINPNQSTKPVIINIVTIIFHANLSGSINIFNNNSILIYHVFPITNSHEVDVCPLYALLPKA